VRTKRAGLVQRAEDWRWSSFNRWLHNPERDPRQLSPWPMARLLRWAERVSKPLTAAERHTVRTSVNRGTPLGDETWVSAHRAATQPPVDPAAMGKAEQRVLRLSDTSVSLVTDGGGLWAPWGGTWGTALNLDRNYLEEVVFYSPGLPRSGTEKGSGLFLREQIAAKLLAWQDHDVRTKRAGLVPRAEDWRWVSFNRWRHQPERDPRQLSPWPMARLLRWAERVNKPLTAAERHAVRNAVRTRVNRGTPLGDETWVQRIALQLNLQSTLRPRGRPKNES
jgi:hypothetical protein